MKGKEIWILHKRQDKCNYITAHEPILLKQKEIKKIRKRNISSIMGVQHAAHIFSLSLFSLPFHDDIKSSITKLLPAC